MTPRRGRAPRKRGGAPGAGPPRPDAGRGSADRRASGARWLLALGAILLATLAVYLPSLDNEFTDWDDNFYVTENPLLRDPDPGAILTTPVAGNYHPLTIASLALNYRLSGLDPRSYHVLSLILHLANTALVFVFARMLSRGRFWTAVATSAFFGIHPMHVESVAWIAERKDVLYTFFYLLGLIAYLRYVDARSRGALVLAFAAFVLSAASKPAAVVFPLTLLAIDWFRRRRMRAVWIEKIPFFLISIAAGLLTLQAQKAGGAITEHWSLFEKVLFASYGTVQYVVKLFLPFGLSAIYPYPSPARGLGPEYYAGLAALLVLGFALLVLLRRSRVVLFGIAFFLINVILVLQFFTIGGAVMADRYTYVPYIGLFLALAWWLDERGPVRAAGVPVKPVIAGLLLLLAPLSLVLTWQRNEVGQNAETLWNDTIAKYPHRIADAYNNRGYYRYTEARRYPEALADFDEALALNPGVAKFWLNKGNVFGAMGRNDSALVCFERALALQPGNADAHNNRGAVKLQIQDFAGAIADFTRALELNPLQRDAYKNRSLAAISLGRREESIADSRRAIDLAPGSPDNYLQFGTIGVALQQLGRNREAVEAFDEAIRRTPPNEPRLGAYFLYRSYAWRALGEAARADADAAEASRRGVRGAP